MDKIGIQPFRDYFPKILGELQWSAKYTISEIIKALPTFIQKMVKLPKEEMHIPIPTFLEYF